MAALFDRRPTLASWPKRIYDWAELPEAFQPALARWQAAGMPPGHVTYIPRVNQYAGSPEFATAWMGEEILLQTADRDGVRQLRFCGRDVALVDYYVQLLRCTVTVTLCRGREAERASFSYNKTKEDQLLPVLNLALGNGADHAARPQHPDTPALRELLEESYAMYNLSKLCYRFGEEIRDFLWLVGRNQGLRRWSRPKPECLAAWMEPGIAWVQKDFYGTRMLCVRWEHRPRFRLETVKGRAFLCLDSDLGPAGRFFLPPEERERAEIFLAAVPPTGSAG